MIQKKRRLIFTVVTISILLIITILTTEIYGVTHPVFDVAGKLLNPVQRIAYSLNSKVEKTIDFYFRFDEIQKENEEIKRKLATYEDKIRKFDELNKDNIELRSMFQLQSQNEKYRYVGVNVISRQMEGLTSSFTLDKGAKDGIKKGMVVITYDGLAGQITEVFNSYCKMQTITNENINVAATKVKTKEYEGIVSGAKILGEPDMAKLTQLPIDANVKEGDDIVTSGLGKLYPPGIYIGHIISVSEDKGKLMKSAILQPAVKLTGTDRFFIIMPLNLEDVTY